ncbi:MAG: WG repeat-containing protein, partial [Bacteroidia bacterium]
ITYQTNIDEFALMNCPHPFYSISDTTNDYYEDEDVEKIRREKWFSQLKDKPYFKNNIYDYISTPKNNILIVIKGDKWGAIDSAGKVIVPLIYEEIISMSIGNLFARKRGKYGFLDYEGKPISDFIYEEVEGWRSNLFVTASFYSIKNTYDIGFDDIGFDENLEERPIRKKIIHTQTFPLFIDEWKCKDTLLEATVNGKMGLINANGKEIIAPKFDNIGMFDYKTYKKDNFIPIRIDSLWGIIRIKTNTPSSCLPQIIFSTPTHLQVSNSSQQKPYEIGKNEKLALLFQIEGCQNIASNKIEIRIDGKVKKLTPLQTKAGSDQLPSQNITFATELSLSEGEHKIEIHYENATSKSLFVKVAKKERRLYVLAIAPTVGLKWNEKDARDFAAMFRNQQGKLYDSVMTKVITGKEQTEKGNLEILIGETIASIKSKMGADDVFILYISSHGVDYDKEKDFLILASNYKVTIPTKTALQLSMLHKDLGDLACKKMIFIDACYSGVANGGAYAVKKAPNQDSLWRRLEHSPNGITYFASSASNQQSIESNRFENGIFTEAILRGIGEMKADENKDNLISIAELAKYLKNTVPLLIKEIAPGLPSTDIQEPTVPTNTNTDIPIYQQ